MKRAHRHELKQNEFLVWLDESYTWFTGHRRNLLLGSAVVVGAVVLIGGGYVYFENRRQESATLMQEALALYHAPIRDSGSVVQAASGPDFASAEERYRKSLEAFEKVFDGFPRSKEAGQARYYAALCQIELGKPEEAEKVLDEVIQGRRDLIYYLASRVLATAKVERGEYQGATDIYRLLVEDPKDPLPKDQLLLELARAWEKAGDLKEARRSYQRVLDEYPESPMRGEALERSEILAYRLEG